MRNGFAFWIENGEKKPAPRLPARADFTSQWGKCVQE